VSANLTTVISSQADNSGLTSAEKSFDQLNRKMKDTQTAATNVGNNYTGILSRIERPLGRTLFASLAAEMLQVDTGAAAVSGSMMALERIFHAVAIASMFAGGQWGTLILIGASLITTMVKLTGAGKDSAEQMGKNVTNAVQMRQKYLEASEVLLKNNTITKEEALALKNAAYAEDQHVLAIKSKLQAQVAETKAAYDKMKADLENLHGTQNLIYYENSLAPFLKKKEEALKNLSMLTVYYTSEQKKLNKEEDDYWQILTKRLEAETKLNEITELKAQYAGVDEKVLNDMVASEKEALKITSQMETTKDEDEKKLLQHHLDYLNKKIASDNSMLTKEKSLYASMASEIKSYTSEFANAWTTSNGQVLFNVGEFAKGMVGKFGDMFAAVCEMTAAKDIAVGDFPGAALAIGEAAAIRSIASVAGGAVSGGTAQVSAPSEAGGGGGGSSTSSGNAGNPIYLTIVLKGGNLKDPGNIAVIAQGLQSFVQQNNGKIIATSVVGG